MHDRDEDDAQRLAVTLGLLLLVGGVLILRELAGIWLAFAIGGGVALALGLPDVIREISARRLHRLHRRLRGW